MARCSICSSGQRLAVEQALASGTVSIRGAAKILEVGRESLRRHVRGHLTPAMREAMATVPGLSPVSLARGLLDSLTAISDAMEDAEERGALGLVYRGAEARARVTAVLADRLGVSRTDALRDLHTAEAIADAMVALARRHPVAGESLAEALDEIGRLDLAADLRSQIRTSTKEIA